MEFRTLPSGSKKPARYLKIELSPEEQAIVADALADYVSVTGGRAQTVARAVERSIRKGEAKVDRD